MTTTKETTMTNKIPAPPANEFANWKHEMAILNADPRTSGSACRPRWLVQKVLAGAAATPSTVKLNPARLVKAVEDRNAVAKLCGW